MQKRIINFQDEGSLTKRMCEKGRLLLLTWNKSFTMNFLFLQSPLIVSFFCLSSFSQISFVLDFDAELFLCAVVLWHVNDCK